MMDWKKVTQLFFFVVVLCVVFVQNVFVSCTDDDPEPTPTITPTPTPTGNAPYLIYPIDDEQISAETITFDWTESIGSTEYWVMLWVWYPSGNSGSWVPLWNNFPQPASESQLTLDRDDIWFYYDADPNNVETFGWLMGDYAWSVMGDTSSTWSEYGYFTWIE